MDKTKALLMGTQNHEKEMMVFNGTQIHRRRY